MIAQTGPREFTLFTHDGHRVLGRHPTYALALAQERAVQAHQHGAPRSNPAPVAFARTRIRTGAARHGGLRGSARAFARAYPREAADVLEQIGGWPSSEPELRALQAVGGADAPANPRGLARRNPDRLPPGVWYSAMLYSPARGGYASVLATRDLGRAERRVAEARAEGRDATVWRSDVPARRNPARGLARPKGPRYGAARDVGRGAPAPATGAAAWRPTATPRPGQTEMGKRFARGVVHAYDSLVAREGAPRSAAQAAAYQARARAIMAATFRRAYGGTFIRAGGVGTHAAAQARHARGVVRARATGREEPRSPAKLAASERAYDRTHPPGYKAFVVRAANVARPKNPRARVYDPRTGLPVRKGTPGALTGAAVASHALAGSARGPRAKLRLVRNPARRRSVATPDARLAGWTRYGAGGTPTNYSRRLGAVEYHIAVVPAARGGAARYHLRGFGHGRWFDLEPGGAVATAGSGRGFGDPAAAAAAARAHHEARRAPARPRANPSPSARRRTAAQRRAAAQRRRRPLAARVAAARPAFGPDAATAQMRARDVAGAPRVEYAYAPAPPLAGPPAEFRPYAATGRKAGIAERAQAWWRHGRKGPAPARPNPAPSRGRARRPTIVARETDATIRQTGPKTFRVRAREVVVTARSNPSGALVWPAQLRPGDTISLPDLGRLHVIQGPYRSARGVRFVDQFGNGVVLRANEGVRLESRANPSSPKRRRAPREWSSDHPLAGQWVTIRMPDGRSIVAKVAAVSTDGAARVGIGPALTRFRTVPLAWLREEPRRGPSRRNPSRGRGRPRRNPPLRARSSLVPLQQTMAEGLHRLGLMRPGVRFEAMDSGGLRITGVDVWHLTTPQADELWSLPHAFSYHPTFDAEAGEIRLRRVRDSGPLGYATDLLNGERGPIVRRRVAGHAANRRRLSFGRRDGRRVAALDALTARLRDALGARGLARGGSAIAWGADDTVRVTGQPLTRGDAEALAVAAAPFGYQGRFDAAAGTLQLHPRVRGNPGPRGRGRGAALVRGHVPPLDVDIRPGAGGDPRAFGRLLRAHGFAPPSAGHPGAWTARLPAFDLAVRPGQASTRRAPARRNPTVYVASAPRAVEDDVRAWARARRVAHVSFLRARRRGYAPLALTALQNQHDPELPAHAVAELQRIARHHGYALKPVGDGAHYYFWPRGTPQGRATARAFENPARGRRARRNPTYALRDGGAPARVRLSGAERARWRQGDAALRGRVLGDAARRAARAGAVVQIELGRDHVVHVSPSGTVREFAFGGPTSRANPGRRRRRR